MKTSSLCQERAKMFMRVEQNQMTSLTQEKYGDETGAISFTR